MSTSSTEFDAAKPAAPLAPQRQAALPNWLREPFLHFIVLGGLLFAIDHVFAERADDPHTIVVGSDVDREAIEVFEKSRGHKPSEEELSALHRVWLDNEVLYREGLALQVDRGDTAIRERVIFKALSLVDAGIKLPQIDDQQLRAWFERHREKYDEPARYNFQEAVLAGANADTSSETNSEATMRSFVQTLNAAANGGSGTIVDTNAGLRVFKDRPHANLVQSYGPEFPNELEAAPPGVWQAFRARDGWHALRLDSITPPKPAVFEVLRGVVLQDWTDATAAEQRTAAVRTLAKKYKVIFPAPEQAGR